MLILKKSPFNLGGPRGRLISQEDRVKAINLITDATTRGARKYKACELLGVSIRTIERWQNNNLEDKRKGAKQTQTNKLTEVEKTMILVTVNCAEYRDLPPCQIVPRLADQGIYIGSESTIYQILREQKQLIHRLKNKTRKHIKQHLVKLDRPMKYEVGTSPICLHRYEVFFSIFTLSWIFLVGKIVGWSIHENQSSGHAAKLVRQACLDENVDKLQVTLHADNGKPMKGATMMEMLKTLGVIPSFSRPSVSDDNPYSEALFKTLKYHPKYPAAKKFTSIIDATGWVIEFVDWYNNYHLHSSLNFISPSQRHNGDGKAILERRCQLYQQAKRAHPERWSRQTRNWSLPDIVTLNPQRKTEGKSVKPSDMATLAA